MPQRPLSTRDRSLPVDVGDSASQLARAAALRTATAEPAVAAAEPAAEHASYVSQLEPAREDGYGDSEQVVTYPY